MKGIYVVQCLVTIGVVMIFVLLGATIYQQHNHNVACTAAHGILVNGYDGVVCVAIEVTIDLESAG